jgi:protein-tyrosine-phosphatase
MKVLFLCTLNAVRSPIAEALARQYYPQHEFHSAGLVAGPPDYFAVEVMQEIGIDIADRKSRSFENLKHKNFDLVIILSHEAKEETEELLTKHKLKYEFWDDIPTPADMGGSRLMRIFSYREIRDKIKARIRNWRPQEKKK